MKTSTLIALAMALALAALTPNEASAAWRRGRFANSNFTARNNRLLLSRPDTIIPRVRDLRAVPNPGSGRLVGYTLNLHPGGRAARMLLIR